jgi:predicted porin
MGVRYSNAQYRGDAQSVRFNVARACSDTGLRPILQLGPGYIYVYGSTAAPGVDGSVASIDQVSAGTPYYLLQRTSLYLVGAYQHADGAFASLGDYDYTSSRKERVIAKLDLLHKF